MGDKRRARAWGFPRLRGLLPRCHLVLEALEALEALTAAGNTDPEDSEVRALMNPRIGQCGQVGHGMGTHPRGPPLAERSPCLFTYSTYNPRRSFLTVFLFFR